MCFHGTKRTPRRTGSVCCRTTESSSSSSSSIHMFQIQTFNGGLHFKPNLTPPPRKTPTIPKPISAKFSPEHHSFTISYLIETCNLPPETAIATSEKIQLRSREKPDSVIALLKSHGFSASQVSKLIPKHPSLLHSDVHSTILPKLEFFYSIGISRPDLARSLTLNPTILNRSLQNQILPHYTFLKSILESDAKIAAALKRTSWIFLSRNLIPNIAVLQQQGVPQRSIALLLTQFPETLIQNLTRFEEIVAEIKRIGFDPTKSTFVLAMHAISGDGNRSLWNRCYDVYRRWGWTREEIVTAFRKHPHCMILSEEKISKEMEFFTAEMELLPAAIAKNPVVLLYSFEKRIVPRCCVIRALWKKGLVKRDLSLTTVLLPAEKRFLEVFVDRFVEEVPELMNLYLGKVDLHQVLASIL